MGLLIGSHDDDPNYLPELSHFGGTVTKSSHNSQRSTKLHELPLMVQFPFRRLLG